MSKYNWKRKRKFRSCIEVLHWGRRTGKTTQMIKRIQANPNGALIVASNQMMRLLINQYPELSNRIFDTARWSRHSPLMRVTTPVDVYLDEAALMPEEFVDRMARNGVLKAITFSAGNSTCRNIATESRNYNHKPAFNRVIEEVMDYYDETTISELAISPLQ